MPESRPRTASTSRLLGARMANATDRMTRSSAIGRVDDWLREPPHTHEWHFPSGLLGPGCGLSLFSLLDGQFGEQHEQPFVEGTPPATADCCDMHLIGQANRPRIVSSTWRARNIEPRRQSRTTSRRGRFPCYPVLIIVRGDTELQWKNMTVAMLIVTIGRR